MRTARIRSVCSDRVTVRSSVGVQMSAKRTGSGASASQSPSKKAESAAAAGKASAQSKDDEHRPVPAHFDTPIRVKMCGVCVKDQDAALDFYVTKLGCKITTMVPFGSKKWIELQPPGGGPALSLYTPDGMEDRIGGFSNVMWSSDDVRKTAAEMKAKGVEFVEEPKEQPWGGIQAIFKDLDGNKFVLHSE